MTLRFVAVATALGIGIVVCSGLYWIFLNTPESNTLMLAASALLVIAFAGAAAVSVNAAILLARGARMGSAIRGGTRGVFWFALALVPLALAWWALGQVDGWVESHAGEVNAWFIAQFGWADVSALMQAQIWTSRWLRWAVFPLLSLSLLATLLGRQGRASSASFLRRAWHWRTLGVATLVFILLFALPWQLTEWRPRVPATWIEPTAAAARLAIVLLLAVAGGTIMILVAAKDHVAND